MLKVLAIEICVPATVLEPLGLQRRLRSLKEILATQYSQPAVTRRCCGEAITKMMG